MPLLAVTSSRKAVVVQSFALPGVIAIHDCVQGVSAWISRFKQAYHLLLVLNSARNIESIPSQHLLSNEAVVAAGDASPQPAQHHLQHNHGDLFSTVSLQSRWLGQPHAPDSTTGGGAIFSPRCC